jgi:outer membrane lipoprotein-sorting protein
MGATLMNDEEKKLSSYIDSLNEEKKPLAHEGSAETSEMEELFETVRLVRSLREPNLPVNNFGEKLAQKISNKLVYEKNSKKYRKRWVLGLVSAAAVVVLVVILNFTLLFDKTNMVYAMNKVFKTVKAYHGILEVVETNALGESKLQSKVEVWADKEGRYYIKGLEGSQKNLTTVNNGQVKWQVQLDENEVNIFSAFPDPYSFTFEIGKEIDNIKSAIQTKVVGDEIVAGREAVVMEVTPQGGSTYKIWIDKENKMPLQKQSSMENSLQYKVSYKDLDFAEAIPNELLTYKVPEGFKEIIKNSEMVISSMEEVEKIVGYTPNLPKNIPATYTQSSISVVNDAKVVKINYISPSSKNKVVVLVGKSTSQFNPASMAVLGKINNNLAEIQSPVQNETGVLVGGGAYAGITDITSVRWQEDGFEYAVVGDDTLDELTIFIKGLTNGDVELSYSNEQSLDKPEVDVTVDMNIEKADQKSVDAGHSPWKLDPAFVAQVFVSLKISPEGIAGEYPIKYEELKIIQNTGKDAVVEVSGKKTPIRKVYLKRLIRQDNTGIWTVIGYDPTEDN